MVLGGELNYYVVRDESVFFQPRAALPLARGYSYCAPTGAIRKSTRPKRIFLRSSYKIHLTIFLTNKDNT
jgi:hypothetical protein